MASLVEETNLLMVVMTIWLFNSTKKKIYFNTVGSEILYAMDD
jgi:hypothetical protein